MANRLRRAFDRRFPLEDEKGSRSDPIVPRAVAAMSEKQIRRARIKRIAGLIFAGLVVLFFGAYLVRHRDQVISIATRRELALAFPLACFCAFFGYLLRGALWALLRREVTGLPMNAWRGFHIASVTGMGRYIPGKVWSFAGKAYMSSESPEDMPGHVAAVLLDNLLFLAAFGFYGVALFLASGVSTALLGTYSAAGTAVMASALVVAEPHIFMRLFNLALRMAHYPPLERKPRYGMVAIILLGNMAAATVWAASFLIMVRALAPIGLSAAVFLAGLFCAGWLLGFFVLIAPAGVGVREGILILGLQQATAMSAAEIVTVVVAARFVSTFVELACAGLVLAVALFHKTLNDPMRESAP
ncbi:MAG TPA: hypothetical protein P5318_04790 [Candidatus Hydrogenedentes bacterium]|nr:hypothetical protein [Candidatus Hydrogenedentota bacterium]